MSATPLTHPGREGRGRAPAFIFLWTALLLLMPSGARAQTPATEIRLAQEGELQELVLRDGSTLYGQVIRLGDPFTFRLTSGAEMPVSVPSVRSLQTAQGEVVEGEFWRDDPNLTRLFFGPTARPLKKGSGYLAVYEIIMPFLGVGITDNLVLAAGTPLIFGGGGVRPFWLAPKYTFLNRENTQAAVGVLAFQVEDESAGIFYGVVSRGGTKASFTAGLGYGYVNDDLADYPAVMLGGELRVSRSLKLVTENYLFPGGSGEGILAIGPRFFGERLSADLGLMMPVGWDDGFFAFPLINFVWNF